MEIAGPGRRAMGKPRPDIMGRMGTGSETMRPGRAGEKRPLRPEDFAAMFASASESLWYIAAAVLGGRADAEDVVQEAALIGLRKVGEFDPATSFSAWMGEIVRNVARNWARKRVRRQTLPQDPVVMDQSLTGRRGDENGAVLTARGDLAPGEGAFDDQILAALRTLEETARICLLLRVLGDLPYTEISRILGIPEGTAMSHVHRARKALRARLAMHPASRRETMP